MARRHREESNIYRRRKLSSSAATPILPNGTDVPLENNVFSDDSTTSAIDESASTVTDFSLSPSFAKVPTGFLSKFSPQGPQMEKELTRGNGDFGKFYVRDNGSYQTGPTGLVTVVDQSGQSDSNSEVSASESVGTNRNGLSFCGDHENENIDKEIKMSDFLGLGIKGEKLDFW
uniref:Uncharacterized protein n=1 Tax=Rhizophora mucronata TaxID=61149 RepID=A0A2P2IRX9_RHIMU